LGGTYITKCKQSLASLTYTPLNAPHSWWKQMWGELGEACWSTEWWK